MPGKLYIVEVGRFCCIKYGRMSFVLLYKKCERLTITTHIVKGESILNITLLYLS